MRTARSSSCLLWGGGLSQCMLGYHPPLGVGLETPPGQTPQLLPWVWAWRSPLARPLNLPPGYGPGDLQGMLGYHTPLPMSTE